MKLKSRYFLKKEKSKIIVIKNLTSNIVESHISVLIVMYFSTQSHIILPLTLQFIESLLKSETMFVQEKITKHGSQEISPVHKVYCFLTICPVCKFHRI